MEWIKKNWMKVVTVLAVLLFLSTCSSNCSNKNKIRTLQKEFAVSDSIISDLNDSLVFYKEQVKDLKRDIKELESMSGLLEKNVKDLNSALKRNVVVTIKNDNYDEYEE